MSRKSDFLDLLEKNDGLTISELAQRMNAEERHISNYIHQCRLEGNVIASVSFKRGHNQHLLVSRAKSKLNAAQFVREQFEKGDEWGIKELADMLDKDELLTRSLITYVRRKYNLNLKRERRDNDTYFKLEEL